ncbi:MAG: aminotransferase class IV [Flammeovirgaceae bacterium]
MKAYYNEQLVEESQISIAIADRAFCYGDGLFETIIGYNGAPQFLKEHLHRLKRGMEAFQFSGWNTRLKAERIQDQITQLCRLNHATRGKARVRIQVWRKAGGLYTPQSTGFHLLITAHPAQSSTQLNALKAAFSQTVRLQYSNTSAYKTMSALPYVLAGLEKKQRNLDELILLSTKEHISECIASNIFWVKNGVIYTPSLRSGCIAGIRREFLVKYFRKAGRIVRRTLAKKATLLNADSIFNCNVAGIHFITQVDKRHFPPSVEIKQLLNGLIEDME